MPLAGFLDQQMARRKAALRQALGSVDVVGEQRGFRSPKRALLDDGDRHRIVEDRAFAHQRGLIEDVAEEDAPEHRGVRRNAETRQRFAIGVGEQTNLGRQVARLGRFDDDKVFAPPLSADETADGCHKTSRTERPG